MARGIAPTKISARRTQKRIAEMFRETFAERGHDGAAVYSLLTAFLPLLTRGRPRAKQEA